MSTISSDLLYGLIGESVRVNRGGPESQKGTVIAVYSDHFILLSENKTFYYYQFQHLKSITKNVKDVAADIGALPTFAEGEDFQGLLQNLKYRWVKINRGGPEKIEGILQDVSSEYVTLIVKEEVVQIPHFHIKSVNYGLQALEEDEIYGYQGYQGYQGNQSNNQQSNQNTVYVPYSRVRATRQSSRYNRSK